jgi:hypothetical protein
MALMIPYHPMNSYECEDAVFNAQNTKEIARTSARNIGLDSKTFINSPVKGEQSFIGEHLTASEGMQLVSRERK